MELTNEFHVNVPVQRAWAVLTDIETIAPCMPGAALEEIEGDEYRGGVKIKVGPITAQYKGKATFLSKDDVNHVAVLKAEGRDTKGQGNASATITATLKAAGDGTDVVVSTDLTITGKVAQFGRGVLADVSSKILGQFVSCLEHDVLVTPEETATSIAGASAASDSATVKPAPPAPAAAPATSNGSGSGNGNGSGEAAKPTVRKIDYKPTEPVDLLGTAGAPVVKRAAPAVAILFLLVWLLRRRKKS
jgi:carbon monoxide dehydrogenase subunit G